MLLDVDYVFGSGIDECLYQFVFGMCGGDQFFFELIDVLMVVVVYVYFFCVEYFGECGVFGDFDVVFGEDIVVEVVVFGVE